MPIKVKKTYFSKAVGVIYVYLLADDILNFFSQKTGVDVTFKFSSTRDNLHETSNPLSRKNKKITNCRLVNYPWLSLDKSI